MTKLERLKTLHSVKEKLINHLAVDVKNNRYVIDITPDEWHKYFETEECKKYNIVPS